MKSFVFFLLMILCGHFAMAQYVVQTDELSAPISVSKYATIADAGNIEYSFNQIRSNQNPLKFKKIDGRFARLGFTNHNFWVKIAFKNSIQIPVLYYLETAEPVTNNVNLYLVDLNGKTILQQSGDELNFDRRALPFRKTIFKLQLNPGETKQAFIELKNDGEKNSMPLILTSDQTFLNSIYAEQFGMGIFYGLLFVIAVTYLFFYFALNELSFLYYSLYVTFTGLCQFALDGFYHQYIGESNNWFNLHFVIISAIFGCYFFGKYSELILEIKFYHNKITKLFKVLYLLLGLLLLGILINQAFLQFSYPVINVLTLAGMLLIFTCVFLTICRKHPVDLFYTGGIIILFLCILGAILMNFGVFPDRISMDNITKPGIGLEILALSLSMANRIRLLKTKKEELQAISLQKAQEMSDIKSYFLSNMSHELRTPLNAIIGLANVTESETKDLNARANCAIIRDTSYSLVSSVNDILDFSKLERGLLKLDETEFDPNHIFDRLSNSIDRLAKDKGLKFNYQNNISDTLILLGDTTRLEQIVHNILNNAVKFTTTGSINFEVQAKIEANFVHFNFSIADTGVGILKEKLEAVFDLFSQNNIDNKRKFGGFGIGLSVTKALVALHHGQIELKSEVNVGTTCQISLTYPLVKIEPKRVLDKVKTVYDLFGKHILVVEDNKMNQLVIKMMLKNWKNTTVSFADDGLHGLEILKNNTIDLVLLDLQMPVMDGYELLTAIRQGQAGVQNTQIPVIVLTADVTAETKAKVFELGTNDYLTKPVDQQLLHKKASALLLIIAQIS